MDDAFFKDLKQKIDDALDQARASGKPPEHLLDLANVKYIDSRGIGTLLLEADRLTSAGGKLRIVNVVPAVMDLLKMLGVDHFLSVESVVLAPAPKKERT